MDETEQLDYKAIAGAEPPPTPFAPPSPQQALGVMGERCSGGGAQAATPRAPGGSKAGHQQVFCAC